jgi:hypothetical protein
MYKIELKTTRGDIKKHNLSFIEPLDLFRIVNVCSPRDWIFKIEFDDKNRNIVNISADPPLSLNNILLALDGRIPAIYNAKCIIVKFDGECYFNDSIYEESDLDNREVYYNFNKYVHDLSCQIKIVGHPPTPKLNKPKDMAEWFYNNTWFGSKKYIGRRFKLNLTVFGCETIINNRKDIGAETSKLKLEKKYNVDYDIFEHGELIVGIESQRKLNVLRHSIYGIFSIEHFDVNFWKNFIKSDVGGYELEFDSRHVEWFTFFGPFDRSYILNIAKKIISNKDKLFNSSEYVEYKNSYEAYIKNKTAVAINKRQERVESAQKINVDGKHYMTVPTCENELVALYMKLESAKKLPFECNVIEYTSRSGIDALANFKLSDVEHLQRYAPVEFEFMLENYFDHGHPIEQTTLIICWDVSEQFNEDTGLNLRKYSDWLYYIDTPIKVLPVFIIKKYKKIKIV